MQYFIEYDIYVTEIQQQEQTIEFKVGASDGTPKKFFTVYLGKDLVSADEFIVALDGESLEMLSVAEFLNPVEDTESGYVYFIGEDGVYLAILTHFSEHVITISPMVQTIALALIGIYVIGILAAVIIFYVPEYVTYFKKVR